MNTIACTPLRLAISAFVIGYSTTVALAEERPAGDAERPNLESIWKKVVEVNQAWLDQRPNSLSYEIVSGSPPPAQPETSQFVWVSGDKARWEMESGNGPNRLEYTLVMTPKRSEYLRGPDALLNKPVEQRSLNSLRQAFTLHTATHALLRHGLPDDASVISDTKDGGDRLIVLETPVEGRSFVGLGLYHLFYGSAQRPIGRTKLTLRLPDHVPLREEFADGTLIKYGPEFVNAGNGLAPRSLRYVSTLPNGDSWILSAEFQIAEGVWLLKTAQNLKNGAVVKQMSVRNVSTEQISDKRFAFPEKK